MKVDGLGVILAIILLPIILVVTYYIQMQVDTIAKENAYNTKLLDATYDAMAAFELNTANEELSSVADSMRSIILASNNTFFNTLATNLGMSNASQENLRPYVPAILYTMYDGYYIYSPAETAVVGEKLEKSDEHQELTASVDYLKVGDDGVRHKVGDEYQYGVATVNSDGTRVQNITISNEEDKFKDKTNYSDYGMILYKERKPDTINEWNEGYYTTDKSKAVTKTDYILKPYTQYSARYINEDNPNKKIDVTINYTLDNYINIEGTIGDVYYTKSGYLIKNDLVTNITIDGVTVDISNSNENDIKNKILGLKTNLDETTTAMANSVSIKVGGNEISASKLDGYNTISEAEEALRKGVLLNNNEIYEIQKYKAIAYYASSAVFSNWVYNNLENLKYENIQDNIDKMGENRLTSKTEDFYYTFEENTTKIFDSTQDPEGAESNFNAHRTEVIKNSIKYNLNQSISAYASMKGDKNKYSMPVLTDTEWDNILSKISIVSFMQGWDCGLDVYNNYEIAYSTNNELTVTPSEIYYVPVSSFNDGQSDYHRIDCPKLDSADGYIAFKSNEIKYDKLPDSNGKYKYDHKNLACYTCINNNNYDSLFENKNDSYYDRINKIKKDINSTEYDGNKVLAGYIGLAAMREGTYKTNALTVSEGYKIVNYGKQLHGEENPSIPVAENVQQVELTFSGAIYKMFDSEHSNNNFVIVVINDKEYTIPLSVTNTILIDNPSRNLTIKVLYDGWINLESVKYIYK